MAWAQVRWGIGQIQNQRHKLIAERINTCDMNTCLKLWFFDYVLYIFKNNHLIIILGEKCMNQKCFEILTFCIDSILLSVIMYVWSKVHDLVVN